MKSKDLSGMTDDELKKVYEQACANLATKLEAFEFNPEAPWDWYSVAEVAWIAIKQCQKELVLRCGRKLAEEYLAYYAEKEQENA